MLRAQQGVDQDALILPIFTSGAFGAGNLSCVHALQCTGARHMVQSSSSWCSVPCLVQASVPWHHAMVLLGTRPRLPGKLVPSKPSHLRTLGCAQ